VTALNSKASETIRETETQLFVLLVWMLRLNATN
jgi:hypothetical protein